MTATTTATNQQGLDIDPMAWVSAPDVSVFHRDTVELGVLPPSQSPWLVQYAHGSLMYFETEDKACDYQLLWRRLNGLSPVTGERDQALGVGDPKLQELTFSRFGRNAYFKEVAMMVYLGCGDDQVPTDTGLARVLAHNNGYPYCFEYSHEDGNGLYFTYGVQNEDQAACLVSRFPFDEAETLRFSAAGECWTPL